MSIKHFFPLKKILTVRLSEKIDFNETSVMQPYTLLVQFGGPRMLQWGVSTSLKYDWRAVEVVEVDAVEAVPPWLALKWSGPLCTFQSHETLAVQLSPSSTQQLGGTF